MTLRATLERRAGEDLAFLDRRGFLKLGTAAAVALLPGCRAAPRGAGPPAGLALEHLTPRTYAVLNAAAARLVGPRGGALVAAGRADPGAGCERFLTETPELAGPMRQALLLLEYGVWPLLPKGRPFTSLAAAQQSAVLDDLAGSRLALKRRVFGGLRSVALLSFYGPVSQAPPAGFAIGLIPPEARIADAMAPPPA